MKMIYNILGLAILMPILANETQSGFPEVNVIFSPITDSNLVLMDTPSGDNADAIGKPYTFKNCIDSIKRSYEIKFSPFPVKKIPCGKFVSGQSDCYGISTGDLNNLIPKEKGLSEDIQKNIHSSSASIKNLLYYAGQYTDLDEYLKETDVKFVALIMSKDPMCEPAYNSIDQLAPTLIGPGSVTISNTKISETTKSQKHGVNVKLSPFESSDNAWAKNFTIPLSKDWAKSVTQSISITQSVTYSSVAGGTCTPSAIRVTQICQGNSIHIIINKNGNIIEKDINVGATAIPSQPSGSFITTHLCSIDYANS